MSITPLRLPTQVIYFGWIIAESLQTICRILMSYLLLFLILFLPFNVKFLQWGSGLLDHSTVNLSIRTNAADDALAIIFSGKIHSNIYNENELSHLFDVRTDIFGVLVASMIVAVVLVYFLLNRPGFQVLNTVKILSYVATGLGVFTVLTIIFFSPSFELFHRLLFPQGNYAFPATSPLIQAFPPSFWMLEYVCLQTGAILLILLQAWYVHHHAQD